MNLVQTSLVVRKGINILILLSILYIVFLFLRPYGIKAYYAAFPPKDLPTVAYGKLDPLQFFEKKVLNSPRYELNTKTGKLPGGFPNKMLVFRLLPSSFSFEAGKVAQKDANWLGYNEGDLITDLKGDVYAWRNTGFGNTLEIQINNGDLVISTPLARLGSSYSSGTLTKATADTIARTMFGSIGRFDPDSLYPNGTSTVYLGRYFLNRIVEVTATRETQIARVDYFRNVLNFPVFGPDPKKGLLHVLLGNPLRGQTVLKFPVAEVYYRQIDTTDTTASYPIIPVTVAWSAVSKGEGIISNVTPRDQSPFEEYRAVSVDRILINEIYLAYYEGLGEQAHLQPIYVFEGNYTSNSGSGGEITVYYPALSGEWVNQPANSENNKEEKSQIDALIGN